MDPDGHTGLVDQTPEGIEAGISWRDETTWRVCRAALDADDSGISLEDTTKLGYRGLNIDEGDHWRRKDSFLIGITPVVFEPPVECFEGGDQCIPIICERFLQADPKRREQETTIKALLVHDRQTSIAITVFGSDWFEVPEEGSNVLCFLVLPSEVLVEAAWFRDGVEQGVRDEPVHLAADKESLPTIDLCPLHGALGHRLVDMTGVGIGRLVVVVIRVERRVVDDGTLSGRSVGGDCGHFTPRSGVNAY